LNISEYFSNLTQKVKRHPLVKKVHVRNEQVSLKKGYVRLTTLFIDESELHIFEYVNSDLRKLSYAYHYQNPSGSLIFRYDNEPHYPALPTFPQHKHISEEKTPEASEEVNIDEVLKEISLHISKTRRKTRKSKKTTQ
jgi:hypothetical protein